MLHALAGQGISGVTFWQALCALCCSDKKGLNMLALWGVERGCGKTTFMSAIMDLFPSKAIGRANFGKDMNQFWAEDLVGKAIGSADEILDWGQVEQKQGHFDLARETYAERKNEGGRRHKFPKLVVCSNFEPTYWLKSERMMTFQMNTPINRTNAVSYPWPHDIPAYNQVAIVGGGVPLFSNQDFRMFFILGFILNGLPCFCNQETIEMAHNEGLPIYFENLPIRLDFMEAAMARDTENFIPLTNLHYLATLYGFGICPPAEGQVGSVKQVLTKFSKEFVTGACFFDKDGQEIAAPNQIKEGSDFEVIRPYQMGLKFAKRGDENTLQGLTKHIPLVVVDDCDFDFEEHKEVPLFWHIYKTLFDFECAPKLIEFIKWNVEGLTSLQYFEKRFRRRANRPSASSDLPHSSTPPLPTFPPSPLQNLTALVSNIYDGQWYQTVLELEGNLQPFVVSDSDVLISNLTKCVAELFWAVKLWDAKRNSPMYRAQYYTEIIRSIIAILRRVDAILFEIMKYSFYLDGRALEAYRYAIHNCTVAVRKEIAEGLFHDAFASYNKAFFPRSEAYYSAYLVDIANVRGDCFGTPDIPIPKQMGTERPMLIKAVSNAKRGWVKLIENSRKHQTNSWRRHMRGPICEYA